MMITLMKAKLHGAIVTQTELKYDGSITIDEELLEKSGMLEHERVQVVNLNNGNRFETYIIKGQRGSNTICLNGPAARLALIGDEIIIIAYAIMSEDEAKKFKPKIVMLDENNKVKKIK